MDCISKVNMAEIAKLAGTSVMTVSRALSNGPCSDKTRMRIGLLAQKLGYSPNKLGGCFMRDRLDTIGVVVPNITQTFFPRVVNALEEALAEEGISVFLCCSRDNPEIEAAKISELIAYRVAGVVLLPSLRSPQSKESADFVVKSGKPLVLVDRLIPKFKCDTVGWKSAEAMYEIVTDLISRGRKRITYVCGEPNEWRSRGRTKGFISALKNANMKPFAQLSCQSEEEIKEKVIEIFSRTSKPDAICCANDYLAMQVLDVMKQLKIRIPQDCTLTGFSGVLDNRNCAISITTAFQDAEKMGREAAKLILKRIKEKKQNTDFEHIKIPLKVLIRESSGA